MDARLTELSRAYVQAKKVLKYVLTADKITQANQCDTAAVILQHPKPHVSDSGFSRYSRM